MAHTRSCTKCGYQIFPADSACASCGNPTREYPQAQQQVKTAKNNTNAIRAIVGLVVAIGAFWYFLGGGIENQVASDAVKEYEIAQRNGTRMDACVHAGLVAAAYLQAKNESDYRQWKAIERTDCSAAGLPGQ